MGNFIGMVYAKLKEDGVDTNGMTPQEAIEKYNEKYGKEGKYGDNKPTEAESKRLKEKGIDEEKSAIPEDDQATADEIINDGKKYFVQDKNEEEAWNNLTRDEQYLLSMSMDMGFNFDELNEEENQIALQKVERKFYKYKEMAKAKSGLNEGQQSFKLDETAQTIINDAIAEVRKKYKNYADENTDNVLKQLDEDMKGFLPDKDTPEYKQIRKYISKQNDKHIYEMTQGRTNGRLDDFYPEDLVDLADKYGAVNTHRSDSIGVNDYSIVVEPNRDGTYWVDIVEYTPDERYDADDIKYYNTQTDRIFMKKLANKEDIVNAVEKFKKTVR